MSKQKEDFSITGAANALHEMFFDAEQAIKKAVDSGPDERKPLGDEPESKRSKPVGNTFNTKEKGKKDERGTGKTGESESDDESDDEPDESDDKSKK